MSSGCQTAVVLLRNVSDAILHEKVDSVSYLSDLT